MSSDTYHIFKATAEHADLLAEFSRHTFREAFGQVTEPRDLEAYISSHFTSEKLTEELSDYRSTVFIAESAGIWVGYVHLKAATPSACVKGPNPIQLFRLYVSGAHQGKGLGQTLMKRCYTYARDKGFNTLWLSTWEENKRAIDVYRQQGFETVGSQIFWVGNDPQNDLIMAKTLGAG
jgi:ribosomal protein S18 acetylase RimI-like enzyme